MTDSDATKPIGAPAAAPRHDPKPGDRVRILKGEHSGKEGRLESIVPHQFWNDAQYNVSIEGDPALRAFGWEHIGPIEPPRRMPLLEYLDKLEATAKAALGGRWTGANDWGPRAPQRDAHIMATQPKATLELIAKLRELASFASAYWPHIVGKDAPLEIEVPE